MSTNKSMKKLKKKQKRNQKRIKFNHAIEKALAGAKAKNIKAVKALLDMEGLKLTDEKNIRFR